MQVIVPWEMEGGPTRVGGWWAGERSINQGRAELLWNRSPCQLPRQQGGMLCKTCGNCMDGSWRRTGGTRTTTQQEWCGSSRMVHGPRHGPRSTAGQEMPASPRRDKISLWEEVVGLHRLPSRHTRSRLPSRCFLGLCSGRLPSPLPGHGNLSVGVGKMSFSTFLPRWGRNSRALGAKRLANQRYL